MALKYAMDKQLEFNYVKFCKEVEIPGDFLMGCVSCLHPLGLIQIEQSRFGVSWRVNALHDDLYRNVEQGVIKMWEDHKGEDHMDFILHSINKVKRFFGEESIS